MIEMILLLTVVDHDRENDGIGDDDDAGDNDDVFQMKALLSSLDSHLGQKGKTFLSGDKVIITIKIIMI